MRLLVIGTSMRLHFIILIVHKNNLGILISPMDLAILIGTQVLSHCNIITIRGTAGIHLIVQKERADLLTGQFHFPIHLVSNSQPRASILQEDLSGIFKIPHTLTFMLKISATIEKSLTMFSNDEQIYIPHWVDIIK